MSSETRNISGIVDVLEGEWARVASWFERPKRVAGIGKYLFIQKRFNDPDFRAEFELRFVAFYGLFRLDPVHREAYFCVLNRYGGCDRPGESDFGTVLDELRWRTGKYHLSFASKLLHTANDRLPIYDSNVARVFGWKPVYGDRDEACERYRLLCLHFRRLSEDGRMAGKVRDLRGRFVRAGIGPEDVGKISDTKMLDFALWALGDVLRSG